ncbi:toll/interleukin-1 receptor domain-containing protein [Saccharopolyspora mangrovi]|uniref:Toll/interleukin-1 receptor domain-containing protein n=1 Tax=Saccharopolyspora mangrovi TaxID=3082379 RepID=A0ABU6AAI5_9PSEU|nr:toll/interleukin-1 receptor domain-containing protein [Saccharopolyspora sp. S2-29]MEB3368587.1 toll/interleukin-1 receptor domain-containing protein [Saccharopolyspora sp. S2-29]
MPEIFVNYRTGFGEQAAAHLEDHLSRHFGSERVFRDATSIDPGVNFQERLQAASSSARVLLAVIGEGWAGAVRNGRIALEDPADWIRREILNAREAGARIIPVLCGHNMEPLRSSELPPELDFLADNQALRLDHRNSGDDLDQITRKLGEIVSGLEKPEGRVRNINHGSVNTLIQSERVGDVTIGDTSSTTHFHGTVTGPLHTGSGPLHVDRTREEEK